MEHSATDILHTAELGFKHFNDGLATGQWENFISMLTDDFTFWFPVGSFQGTNVGKSQAKTFFNYVTDQVFPQGLFLTVNRITQNKITVVFEVKSEGTIMGKPYQNQAAISFDIRGDKICGYREYLTVNYQLIIQQ